MEWKSNKASKDDFAQDEEDTAPPGPRYEKSTLLRFFVAIQSDGSAASTTPVEVAQAEPSAQESDVAGDLPLKVEERPADQDAEEGGRSQGLRRILREQKKAKKAAAAAEAGEEHTFSKEVAPDAPQANVSQSLELGGMTPTAAHPAPFPPWGGYSMYQGTMYPPYAAPPPAAPPPGQGLTTSSASYSPLHAALPKATAKSMVLLRHVPTDLTRESLVELLNKDFKGTFDFVYLPGSTKKDGGNRGYAFINFRRKAEKFIEVCHGVAPSVALGTSKDDKDDECEKDLEIEKARLPTLDKTLSEMARKPRPEAAPWQPLLFDESGQAKPFPLMPPPPPMAASPDAYGASMAHVPQTPWSAYPHWPGMYHAYSPAMAAQVADAHRRAAVAARAAVGEHTPPLDEDRKKKLREQIEYYYSDANLCKDVYLRSFMNAEGWTPLELIAEFPKVKAYNVSEKQILEALKLSSTLEVDPLTLYIRLRSEKDRANWTKATSEYRSQMAAAIMQSYSSPQSQGAASGKSGGGRRKTGEGLKGGSKGRGGKSSKGAAVAAFDKATSNSALASNSCDVMTEASVPPREGPSCSQPRL